MDRLRDKFEVSLVGHRGAMEDLVFKILAETVTIGRNPDNDIVLDDPIISGEHARIAWDGVAFEIVDLGSKTGVRVNTKPVQEAEIRDGDRIRIGNSIFIFTVKSKAAGLPSDAGLMGQKPQLDAAARVRIAIYGVVTMFLLLVMVALLGKGKDVKGLGSGGVGAEGRVDIGTLTIEQYTMPTHEPNEGQLRQASLHLRQGIIELDSGNLLSAIGELKKALDQNPRCDACKAQMDWAFGQLRKTIAYHYEAGDDDFKNLRYREAVRHWDVVRKMVQPADPISVELEKRIALANQKQAELDRRAVGLQ